MTSALRVRPGHVAEDMLAKKDRGRLWRLKASFPTVRKPDPSAEWSKPKLVETISCFLEVLNDSVAEFLLQPTDGPEEVYKMPPGELRALGLHEGDDFLIDIFEQGGVRTSRFRKADPLPTPPPPPGGYDSPEDLDRLSNWP